MTFALDTNIVTYALKGDEDVLSSIVSEVKKGNDIIIPPTVYYETIRWLKLLNSQKKIKSFDKLHRDVIESLGRGVLDKAADIYAGLKRNGNIIDDGDILIAAFCIINNYTLVTNNAKHFKIIDGLQYVNWK